MRCADDGSYYRNPPLAETEAEETAYHKANFKRFKRLRKAEKECDQETVKAMRGGQPRYT